MNEKRLRKVLERIRVDNGFLVLSRFRPTVNIPLIPLLLHPCFRGPKLGREIITRCARTKSHTYYRDSVQNNRDSVQNSGTETNVTSLLYNRDSVQNK